MNIGLDELLEWYYNVVSIDFDFQKQLGMRFDRIVGLRESMERFFELEILVFSRLLSRSFQRDS